MVSLTHLLLLQFADGEGDGGKAAPKSRGKKGARGSGHSAPLKFAFIDEAAHFTGTSRDFGDRMVCPELLEHVGKEIERDASVLKQVRKAREERRAALR